MKITVSYCDIDGIYHTEQLLKDLPALRRLKWIREQWAYRNQSNTPGKFYFSSLQRHIYYESYLESQVLLHLDYLSDITALVEQPFVLHHAKRSHIPDFVFQNDSGITLVNVKPAAFVDHEDNQWTFSVAQAAAQQLGWQYKTISELNPQYLDNLHWLFGFKDIPFDLEPIQNDVLDCLEQPSTLSKVLSQLSNPFIVKPVVFHLMWHRIIHTNLQQRFFLHMPLWRALEAT